MPYPHFYTQVPSIKLYDPLSDFLGAFKEGQLSISYLECVKLSGHSCPTVAGAYLMTKIALKELYPDTLPQRGNIKIEFKKSKNIEVTGVTANVIAFIVGASDEGGFKGIAGYFSRTNLLFFNSPIEDEVKFTRTDTQQSLTISYNPSVIPPDTLLQPLMKKIIQNIATKKEKKMFQTLWQKRVEEILLDTQKHSKVFTITLLN